MTKRELLQRLAKYDDDMEIMIMDEFNGNGAPRTINFGPVCTTVTDEDVDETSDCEGLVGQEVIVIGFGSY